MRPPAPLTDRLGKGGFGSVYRDPRDPSARCIKIYARPLKGDQASELRRLASVEEWARPSDAAAFKAGFAWPLEIFADAQSVIGYTMPLAPEDAFFELDAAGKRQRKLLEVGFLVSEAYFQRLSVRSEMPPFDASDRIELSINIFDLLGRLHEYELVYQDISGRNLLGRLNHKDQCFFLDADSISSIAFAESNPVKSPGWEVPSTLTGPLERDRARAALLCLRLLTRDQDARFDNSSHDLAWTGKAELEHALRETYLHGRFDSFNQVGMMLRGVRAPHIVAKAAERAMKSGFARNVLREGLPHASVPSLRALIEEAEEYLRIESEMTTSDLRQRMQILQRLERLDRFDLDLSPDMAKADEPRDREELLDLVFNAEFARIARQLAATGLGRVIRDPLLPRIIERAMFQVDDIEPDVRVSEGSADVVIKWPSERFCNIARIDIGAGPTAVSDVARRDKVSSPIRRVLRSSTGTTLELKVRFGVSSPEGHDFLPQTTTHSTRISIPPKPVPVQQRRTAAAQPEANPSIIMADPIMDATLAHESRMRRRRQSIASVVAIVLIAPFAYFGLQWWLTGEPLPPIFPHCPQGTSGVCVS